MIEIISPEEFKTIPWKNGQGSTTELVISPDATLDSFDWRLSIAKVDQDGEFSDFSGYMRHLILIEGEGITLSHTNQQGTQIDKLNSLLNISNFDGGSKTIGELQAGPIKDFNIMVDKEKYQAKIKTYVENQQVLLESKTLCFVYALSAEAELKAVNQTNQETQQYHLPEKHLLKISVQEDQSLEDEYQLVGENMIVIYIEPCG